MNSSDPVSPRDGGLLILLAALWGGSFIFMRVASPAFGPLPTGVLRAGIAAIALLAYLTLTKTPLDFATHWRKYLVVGFFNTAVPFAGICWAELHISASAAAILNATSPLFGGLVGYFWLKDALGARKVVGLLISFVGVILLVGWGGVENSLEARLGVASMMVVSFSYGFSANYIKARVMTGEGAPSPLALAAASQVIGTLILAPSLPFTWPTQAIPSQAWGCVVTLALFSTAFAWVLYFRLIRSIGPTRALAVTFIVPIFGMVWGALFLREVISIAEIASSAVILVGTGLAVSGNRAR